ncbi:MAG: hypothetical protein L3J50_10350, partial [Emcibacter sp.]|nr:hypothetical protein [Emcibacter sp.]
MIKILLPALYFFLIANIPQCAASEDSMWLYNNSKKAEEWIINENEKTYNFLVRSTQFKNIQKDLTMLTNGSYVANSYGFSNDHIYRIIYNKDNNAGLFQKATTPLDPETKWTDILDLRTLPLAHNAKYSISDYLCFKYTQCLISFSVEGSKNKISYEVNLLTGQRPANFFQVETPSIFYKYWLTTDALLLVTISDPAEKYKATFRIWRRGEKKENA